MQESKSYTASKPEQTWVKPILWRILFPPILLWDFFKWLFNWFLGELLGKFLVLPAQQMSLPSIDLDFNGTTLRSKDEYKPMI